MPLFLVANEFFDALPIRQFRFKRNAWFERLVGADGDSLVFHWSDRVQCDRLPEGNPDPVASEIVEVRPLADRIVGEVSRRIQDFGGLALIVDYGDLNLSGSTLQAVRDHRFADPLDGPGTADLTSHVDFGAIIRSAIGVAATSLLTQGEFLGRMGIANRAQALAASASSEQLHTHAAAYRRLKDPDEMGTLFKALALHPPRFPNPSGIFTMTAEFLKSELLDPNPHGFFSRLGGVSEGPFAGLNCGERSGDRLNNVARNRGRVAAALGIASERLVTATQTHSAHVEIIREVPRDRPAADGLVTDLPEVAVGVLTADCQPVLLADRRAGIVGAVHAGWTGTLGGVMENGISAMERIGARRSRIAAAVGPAISQANYEVGAEFRETISGRGRGECRLFHGGRKGTAFV